MGERGTGAPQCLPITCPRLTPHTGADLGRTIDSGLTERPTTGAVQFSCEDRTPGIVTKSGGPASSLAGSEECPPARAFALSCHRPAGSSVALACDSDCDWLPLSGGVISSDPSSPHSGLSCAVVSVAPIALRKITAPEASRTVVFSVGGTDPLGLLGEPCRWWAIGRLFPEGRPSRLSPLWVRKGYPPSRRPWVVRHYDPSSQVRGQIQR